ncbi:MAG: penicillin-binding protein [Defluviitaleaceae bacterium]|nr:penicillin-binding protein [Defluviitaleaceae bacterium]
MQNFKSQKNKVQGSTGPKNETLAILLKTVFLCLILSVTAAAVFIGMWVEDVLAETPELDLSNITQIQSAVIFDRTGELVFEFGLQRSEWVYFNDISPVMIDAISAIEDARFFEHYGVDWSRTLAAVAYTVENLLTGVDSMQGGSTLTQQLINQTHLLLEDGDRDNSIDRKIREIALAIEIEQILSKEQIMEAYLNIAPFGGRIHGIQAASQFYFGVDASQLTLSQAATLAGIVQLPSVHRPDWNAPQAQTRRDTVLDLMVHHDFITQEIRDLAAAEPITDVLVYDESGLEDIHRYQSFIDRVREEALLRFGIEQLDGYQIYTTLDREAQAFVYNLLTGHGDFFWPNEDIQTAVAMIGNDGSVRALAYRDMRSNRVQMGFNPAVHGERQPGSASKPIWAYGPAFEYLNWGTGSMITDELFGYDGGFPGSPLVRNWDGRYRGRVSVRDAMNQSWNVPAIKAYQAVVDTFGQAHLDQFVNRLGIPTPPNGFNQRYAIGGMYHGVSPLQMAGAYATFPNGGVFNEPFTILRIVAPDGTIIHGEQYHRSERIMSESSAYMMNSILRTAVTGSPNSPGTGGLAQVPGQWVAGKTGTTNFDITIRQMHPHIPDGGVPDSWFVGYSMDDTIAIWTGYRSVASGHFLNTYDQRIPQRLFARIMGELGTNEWREPVRPSTVVAERVEWQSGTGEGEACLPSGFTPGGAIRDEFFHAHAVPTCVSNRFSSPDAPRNLNATAGGGLTIHFTWDHGGDNLPMTLGQATAARDNGLGLMANQEVMTEALHNLTIGPGAAQMIISQIEAVGEAEYVLIGTFLNGSTRELGRTTHNRLSVDLPVSDALAIQSFHVVARFTSSNRSSEPSNAIPNSGFIDVSALEIRLDDMRGWSLERAQRWIAGHVEDIRYELVLEYSDTVPVNQIIAMNPTGSLRPDQVLHLVVSLGPEPAIPIIPTLPEPEVEEELDDLPPDLMPGLEDAVGME